MPPNIHTEGFPLREDTANDKSERQLCYAYAIILDVVIMDAIAAGLDPSRNADKDAQELLWRAKSFAIAIMDEKK